MDVAPDKLEHVSDQDSHRPCGARDRVQQLGRAAAFVPGVFGGTMADGGGAQEPHWLLRQSAGWQLWTARLPTGSALGDRGCC